MNKTNILLAPATLLLILSPGIASANVSSTIESINALSDRAGYQVNDVILTSELQRRVQTEAALQQAYYALLSELSDIEADNTLEATGMRLAMTGYTAPVNGGFVPVSSIAPKVDGHGMPLGYCAWDHGATTGSTDHIAGNTLVNNADPSFVVISSGTNRTFDTTCSDAALGNLGGDDSAMAVSVGQGNYGVATNAYYGKPVASRAVLESLDTTSTEPGEMRMVLDSGMAYAWLDLNSDGIYQWEAVSSYFYSGDSNGLAAGGEYTTSPYAVGIGPLFQDRSIAPMSALEVDGQVRIVDGDTWVDDAVGAQLHVGSQQAAAGTAGEVARMAIQPFSQTGGPFAFVARDTTTDAFLDVRYGNKTAAESILSIRNTGQVGIDSATPNAKLAIGGGDDPTQGPMLNLHGSGVNQFESGRIRLTESGDRFQGAYIHYDASSGVDGGTDGTLHIGMHNLNTNNVADDKNIISIGRNNGHVGINNETPKHQLDVDGDIRASGGIFFGDLTIEARSTGLNRDGAAYLKHDGVEYYASHGRGLNLTIYEPDGTVVSSVRYDTHGVASDSNSLALAIDNMLIDQIGVITSRDAYSNNFTAALRQTAKDNGLIKMANSPATPYRVPYAAIFQKGDSTKAYEQTSTDASDGQRAFLYATIKNGTFFVMPSGGGVNGLQNSRSQYQAYITQDNTFESLGGINAKGVTSISDSANNGPSVHYPGSFNHNGTSTNGYTLKTKIKGPSTKNGMHSVNVRGYAYGNSETIDFTVSFYSYMPSGSLRNIAFMNNGSYDPGVVEIAVDSNDNALIRWENSLYWPRFYATYFASGQNEGRDEALGWTMDTTIPSLSTYAKYRVVTSEAPSMLTLGTSMKNQDDMNNSPISIRERNRIGAATVSDKYGPNLNFNWKGHDSKSLWMDAQGVLNYGGYSADGTPSTDGEFNTDVLNTSNLRIDRGDTSGLQDGYMVVDRVGNFGDEIGLLIRMDGDGDLNDDGLFTLGQDDIAIEVQSDEGGIPSNATTKFRLWSDGTLWTSKRIEVGDNAVPDITGRTERVTAKGLSAGWYTIATNSGDRATARFGLTDRTGGQHQTAVFYATHIYGSSNTINVLSSNVWGRSGVSKLRIKGGGIYDGALLQVYVDANTDNNLEIDMLGDNLQVSGWKLADWVPDGTNPGGVSSFASLSDIHAEVSLNGIERGGMATTGSIIMGNNPDASGLDSEIIWSKNTDGARIGFHNTSDSASSDSYLYFQTSDNETEYFKWRHRRTAGAGGGTVEWMRLEEEGLYFGNTLGRGVYFGNVFNGGTESSYIRQHATKVGQLQIGSDDEVEFIETDAGTASARLNTNSGNLWVKGSYSSSSDARLKRDISTINHGLDKVRKMNGVSYFWKKDRNDDQRMKYGFIAQNIQAVLPSAVMEDHEGYLSVEYNAIAPVMLEAIKELDKKDQQQDEAIERHESILEKLKADIRRHETRLQGLESGEGIESSTSTSKQAEEASDKEKVVEPTVVARPPSAMTRFYGQ